MLIGIDEAVRKPGRLSQDLVSIFLKILTRYEHSGGLFIKVTYYF